MCICFQFRELYTECYPKECHKFVKLKGKILFFDAKLYENMKKQKFKKNHVRVHNRLAELR